MLRAAAGLAVVAAAAVALAGPAAARSGSASQSGPVPPVSLTIVSVNPPFARPGAPVTVSGLVTNTSRAAVTGLSVQLRSSASWFTSRDELQQYADGTALIDSPVTGALVHVGGRLAPHATARWSIRLAAGRVGMTVFGVYPLAAQAVSAAGAPLVTSRTFLPYWPARHGTYRRPVPQNISWILPLVDVPDQSACPGLLTNGLAASLAPGGRLSQLLAAGSAHATDAALTWAVDPALLTSANIMTRRYQVGGNAECGNARVLPASAAAKSWLGTLQSATAGHPVFITPYADVDVAALTRQSLDQDVRAALSEGGAAATGILHRDFLTPAARQAAPAGRQELNGLAWPADGIADYAVIENLAVNGFKTVVLDSTMMPPVQPPAYTPSAVTSTPDGETGDMHVLLSDHVLTQILRTADSPTTAPGAAFAAAQRFLAETAMIGAEAPNTQRALVVAPPRRWNPPAGLAASLLAETATAPWLRPVALPDLAASTSGAGQVPRSAPHGSSPAELSGKLLRKVRMLDHRVRLLQSIRLSADPALYRMVAAVESSAWRGAERAQAWTLLSRASGYLTGQEGGPIIVSPKPVTLGGLRGTVPVSISNRLGYKVQVRLGVSVPAGARVTVGNLPAVIRVPPNSVVNVTIKVHAAAIGTTILGLSLLTPAGRPLPGTGVSMTVHATHFGTLALVIVAAALGVFMVSSAIRAIRRGRPAPPEGTGAGQPRARAGRAVGRGPAGAGSVMPSNAEPEESGREPAGRDSAAAAGQHPTKETDDYAPAPGWADRS